MKPILPVVTFRALIDEHYLSAGFTGDRWRAKITLDTGISLGSLRSAYAGKRVSPDTAGRLALWAARAHKVDLDQLALIHAPTRPPRKAAR